MYPEREKQILIDICKSINEVISKIADEIKFSYLSEIGELLKTLNKHLQEDFDVSGKLKQYIETIYQIYNNCVSEAKKCNKPDFNPIESGIYILNELKRMKEEYICKIVYYLSKIQ